MAWPKYHELKQDVTNALCRKYVVKRDATMPRFSKLFDINPPPPEGSFKIFEPVAIRVKVTLMSYGPGLFG